MYALVAKNPYMEMTTMLSGFKDGMRLGKNIKKIKSLLDTPAAPQTYFHNFVAVKYIDNANKTHRRVMYGSLCKNLNIDLTAFTMKELEQLIESEVFPLIEKNHDLKIHRGSNHIRVWKDAANSGNENYLLISDTQLYDN